MKSKLSKYYARVFTEHKKFSNRYFPAKYKKGSYKIKSFKQYDYLAGVELSNKVVKFLEAKNIKIFYAETRRNSSLSPTDFIEYAHIKVNINGIVCALEFQIGSEIPFIIYVGSSSNYSDVSWHTMVNVSLREVNNDIEFSLSQGDDEYFQKEVLPDVANVLNELRYSNTPISTEQMFQYSLLDKDMETYIHCANALKYFYKSYKEKGTLNAFTLYNM